MWQNVCFLFPPMFRLVGQAGINDPCQDQLLLAKWSFSSPVIPPTLLTGILL